MGFFLHHFYLYLKSNPQFFNMKTKHFLKPFLLLFFSVTLLSSCSSDSSSSGGDTAPLFDKWWYYTGNYTADLFFHANGVYEQKLVFGGTTFANTGTWEWISESQKVMHVSYSTGPNAVSEAWFKFSNIQQHSFTVKQSIDGGTTYSDPVNYSDTDSN